MTLNKMVDESFTDKDYPAVPEPTIQEIHHVCPISYFQYLDHERKTIDTYFQSTWRERHPWFEWGYNLHFFIKPENFRLLSEEQVKEYEARIKSYNETHYKK